ncbi:MAG: hypothetical protein Q6370_013565, partial [Candidatus Sigynarchaeota archaeon]
LKERGTGPYTSITSGKTYQTLKELAAEYATIDVGQRLPWEPVVGNPELVDVAERVLAWAYETEEFDYPGDVRDLLRHIGLRDTMNELEARFEATLKRQRNQPRIQHAEIDVRARIESELQGKTGFPIPVDHLNNNLASKIELAKTIIADMARFDNHNKITEAMIIEEGNKVYVKPTLKERVLASYRTEGEVVGKVLGKIKERFALERMTYLRDLLNDLTTAGQEAAVKSILDAYFFDGELAWQRIAGKLVTWDVQEFKAEKSATTDYAIFALPVGTRDVSQALLRIDQEQKDEGGTDLSSDGGRIVEQFIRQFVQEVGSNGQIVLDPATMRANAQKQYAKFLDIVADPGNYRVMRNGREIINDRYFQQKELLNYIKNLPDAIRQKLVFPNGFQGVLQAFMSSTARTIGTYRGVHPIADVSSVQVTFEETRPGSKKYAWVVQFVVTPIDSSNPKNPIRLTGEAFSVRLIVGYHLTASTRSQFEAVIRRVFDDWRTGAGLPPTW